MPPRRTTGFPSPLASLLAGYRTACIAIYVFPCRLRSRQPSYLQPFDPQASLWKAQHSKTCNSQVATKPDIIHLISISGRVMDVNSDKKISTNDEDSNVRYVLCCKGCSPHPIDQVVYQTLLGCGTVDMERLLLIYARKKQTAQAPPSWETTTPQNPTGISLPYTLCNEGPPPRDVVPCFLH